jgi:hypothetical protein
VCILAQDFLQEQDFPGSNLITADHVGKKPVYRGANCSSVVLELRRRIPLRTLNSARVAPEEKALWKEAPPEFYENAGANYILQRKNGFSQKS